MKPMFPTYTIKNHAKRSMKGKLLKLMAVAFIPDVIIAVVMLAFVFIVPGAKESVALITKGNFETAEARTAYMAEIVSNIGLAGNAFGVLFAFLSVGRMKALLDAVRGKEVKIKTVFAFYDRWYICAMYPLLMNGVYFLATRLTNAMLTWGVMDEVVSAVNMLLLLLYYIIDLKFMFIYAQLADSDCNSFVPAFKNAWRMTGVNTILNMVILSVSFFGWVILCGIIPPVMLYLYPYIQLSTAALYEANLIFAAKAAGETDEYNPGA